MGYTFAAAGVDSLTKTRFNNALENDNEQPTL
jgi:hypothetical protein